LFLSGEEEKEFKFDSFFKFKLESEFISDTSRFEFKLEVCSSFNLLLDLINSLGGV